MVLERTLLILDFYFEKLRNNCDVLENFIAVYGENFR